MSPTATATASRSTPCWSSAASSNLDLRLRAANGAYHWFNVKARPVIGSDGEVIRVIGTLADVTEQRTAQERLLHDAVHDNLTGLPNRKLFQDRLGAVFGFTRADDNIRPTVSSSMSTASSRSTDPSASRPAIRSC
jgi:predicted signal transduction protein with EAL and GGDEF domain